MKKIRPVMTTFFAGLLLGILWSNLRENHALGMNSIADTTLLRRYLQEGVENRDYFMYLLRYRGCGYLLGALFGISIFGIPMCILWMSAMGFFIGSILASTLLAGGIWGFVAGMGMLLPQYLIYIPVSLLLYQDCWMMSVRCWRNQRLTVKLYKVYAFRMIFYLLLITVGFLLESFVNPLFLKILLSKINFF